MPGSLLKHSLTRCTPSIWCRSVSFPKQKRELEALVEIDPTGTLIGFDSLEDSVLEQILISLGVLGVNETRSIEQGASMRKIIELNPNSAIAHNNLSNLLTEQFGEHEKAREHYERANKIEEVSRMAKVKKSKAKVREQPIRTSALGSCG